MENRRLLKFVILFFIVLFFCFLCILNFLLKDIILENTKNVDVSVTVGEPKTVEEVAENADSKILKTSDSTVFIEFAKDLFDEYGNSNETYFNKTIEDFKNIYVKQDFTLIDNKKHINISAKYNKDNRKHSILINGLDGYFERIDGNNYAKANNITIGDVSVMFEADDYLKVLKAYHMDPRLINSELGEGKDLGNGYVSYKDDSIQIRTSLIKTVRNIIFTRKYEGEIVNDVKVGKSLKEIHELYPNNIFGGISQNYLGYMTNDFYYFFYDDEISVYGLTYRDDEEFERILVEYLNDKDLDRFVNSIKSTLRYYDYFEYDPEIKKAHIMFSSRGYEIDIEENDPKGIILYNNYHFTDTTRNLVKEGKISIKEYENLVDKIEKDRRKNR